VAGNGVAGVTGDGGAATAAKINNAHFCAFDKSGNFYFSQFAGHSIRKVSTAGVISTYAGTGAYGFSGDGGPATAAKFRFPEGIAFDSADNFYISDHQNFRIRKIDKITGTITTFAGSGIGGDSGDGGSAIAAMFIPGDIQFDWRGNFYITDNTNHKIRKISTSGVITTYAGTGIPGFSGDGGPATAAQLYQPNGFTIDKIGNLFFADAGNKRIRKIDTFGIITTVAGMGTGIYSGDEIPATNAQIGPYTVAIDEHSNIYAADTNNRIRMIDVLGIIHTVAGNGVFGFNGDGIPATSAQINNPGDITIDACGKVYFADVLNNRIRKIDMPTIYTTPSIALSGSVCAPAGTTVTVTATVASAGSSYIVHWLNHGLEFTSTTVPSVTYTKPPGIDTITARIVPTGWGCWDSTVSAGHIVVEGPTSPQPSPKEREVLRMWPNPAGDMLYISGDVATYRIISIVGAVHQQGTITPVTTCIPLTALPTGTYLLEATTTTGQKVLRRVVKE
jgi:sugar lactone lactonase YvrE